MEAFLHDLSWVLPLRSDAATIVFNGFTALGYLPFFLVFLPLGYWLWDKDLFTRLAVLILLTAIINAFFKDVFQDPRPALQYALDPRPGESYGMPSGHAQVAAAMWIWFAYELRRWWFWPIAIFIVAGVAFSRLYLGVHDVEDILVGLALGGLSLAIFAIFVSDRFKYWHELHPAWQIGILLAVQPLMWLLWPKEGGPGAVASIGAFLFGWWLGVLYDRHRMDFKRHPNWIVALVAAAAGLGIVFAMLGAIESNLVAVGVTKPAASYVQLLVVALFVTAIAPWLFRTARIGK